MRSLAPKQGGRAVALAGAIAGVLLPCAGCGGSGDATGQTQAARPAGLAQLVAAARDSEPVAALKATVPLPDLTPDPPPDVPGPKFAIAAVRPGAHVALRSAPGGRVLARLGDRTEFGSERTFWIERVQGGWFGVTAPELPDGALGWIRDNRLDLDVLVTHYWMAASISARTVALYYGNRMLDRITVTVGSPQSPTPPGDYAVTDALAGRGNGPWYGCCILALSGHQPRLPPGWIGGNRMAIHGTPGAVGLATSAGCLRASDADMVSLFARVPLGAPLFIRA